MYINGECMAKFETLLDHNVTPYEFRKISGFEWSERFVYLDVVKRASKYGDFIDIALLYLSRGDFQKALEYSERPDVDYGSDWDISL